MENLIEVLNSDVKTPESFIERWRGHGEEKSEMQKFWLDLLESVCGVENAFEVIDFEKKIKDKDSSLLRIDAYIASTKVLIEQKSLNVDLDKKIQQSDGEYLTPFEQAKRYYGGLPHYENPRWIIVSNFKEFHIHDMNMPEAEPEIILLENLEEEAEKFRFLIDVNAKAPREIREEKISQEAGRLVEKLKNNLEPLYDPANDEVEIERQKKSLTVFCVRIVFLLYAEDSGLLEKNQFHDYLQARRLMPKEALEKLFKILSQKPEERSPNLHKDFKKFPYVNGGLFDKKVIEVPEIDDKVLDIILCEMSEGFNWSGITPPIFGAIFERVLSGERISQGMHYTTLENIHKVIDPLFLDDLKIELENILANSNGGTRIKKLLNFQNKLAALRFLDPACGSGNFLTESFISLRRLENQILRELPDPEIKVSISQFHGIEINDFAVAVARTALYIANHQMWREAGNLTKLDPLPLKNINRIKEESAMTLNPDTAPDSSEEEYVWRDPGWTVQHDDMLYIIGNPPFIGYSQQDQGQKKEVERLLGSKKVDYVACWFALASEYLQDKKTKAAFVATNSITQGEQVAAIFKTLHERWGIEIDFAYQSFVWDSELKDLKAHVHCVIIGFSTNPPKLRKLYRAPGDFDLVENINFYLKPAPNFFIEARKEPICKDVPPMILGNLPRDGGNLILSPEERREIIKSNPNAEKFIKPFMGGEDFIQRKSRYCLWLVDAKPEEIKKCPKIMKRIKNVKNFRLSSVREATKRLADSPTIFAENRQPDGNYIVVPRTSSENRDYIPIDWLNPETITGDSLHAIPGADLYHFGVLTSRVHMAWMRATAGRLKSDYRYSNTIVYNNFVWPSVNDKQRKKIESTAQKILDARALYPESSFAALYDTLNGLMPTELLKAHKANDAAVCEAYGFDKDISEEDIVVALMKLYEKIAE